MLQKVWAWWRNYDGTRTGFPSPSTQLLIGAVLVVVGIAAMAKGGIGAGVFAIVLGALCIAWAESRHRTPADD